MPLSVAAQRFYDEHHTLRYYLFAVVRAKDIDTAVKKELIDYALQQFADINERKALLDKPYGNSLHETILECAFYGCKNYQESGELIVFLIEKGANLQPGLYVAITGSYFAYLRLLLLSGADLEKRDLTKPVSPAQTPQQLLKSKPEEYRIPLERFISETQEILRTCRSLEEAAQKALRTKQHIESVQHFEALAEIYCRVNRESLQHEKDKKSAEAFQTFYLRKAYGYYARALCVLEEANEGVVTAELIACATQWQGQLQEQCAGLGEHFLRPGEQRIEVYRKRYEAHHAMATSQDVTQAIRLQEECGDYYYELAEGSQQWGPQLTMHFLQQAYYCYRAGINYAKESVLSNAAEFIIVLLQKLIERCNQLERRGAVSLQTFREELRSYESPEPSVAEEKDGATSETSSLLRHRFLSRQAPAPTATSQTKLGNIVHWGLRDLIAQSGPNSPETTHSHSPSGEKESERHSPRH